MATNKHATIRYHALDRCFSNNGRKFFIEDLLESCNDAIYEYTGSNIGIKRRQIFDDIKFMESEQGWSIELDRFKDGRRTFYRYRDPIFTIKDKGITQFEAEQLKDTFSILGRFKGLPQFEWIEETLIRIQDTFYLNGNETPKISFDENPYLKGLNNYAKIFNAISNQTVLEIEYRGFKQPQSESFDFHPWFLKQYNNRWFVFGLNDSYGSLSNLAIDRIISLNESRKKFKPNKEIDFDEYFENVIGVSVDPNKTSEKIMIHIDKQLWPYIENKPLHGSQIKKSVNPDGTIIQLEVQINYELISMLFSYMDGIEILEPKVLRELLQIKTQNILNKYN